jgi:hypothetical protein
LGVILYLELSDDLGVMCHRIFRCPTSGEVWLAIDGLAREGSTLYVFAHNASYDLQLSDGLRHMWALGWNVRRIFDDQGRCVVLWERRRHYVWLVDTYFILRGSLKEIGDLIGVPKWELPEEGADEELWWTYCARDAFILAAGIVSWLKFIKEHDLGAWQPTLAGQAFAAYRHRFMGERIYAARDEDVLELELEAYRGGRCEAFFIGRPKGRRFYKLDVNSMYPYVMANYDHPVAPLWKGRGLSLRKLKEFLARFWVIAEVTLDTNEPVYGIRRKGKLIFPTGRFRAVLCGEEIRYALEHGHIKAVGRFAIYKKSSPFRTYVNYFWQLRQEAKAQGNAVLERNAKLFLNALYGKFGQRGRKDIVITAGEEVGWGYMVTVHAETGKSSIVRLLGDTAIESAKEGVGWYASPALAASVTAAARVYLWLLMKAAGRNNVYYCDTDSLIVNEEGLRKLRPFINPSQLGLLKLEGETDYLEVRGVKNYVFGKEEKVAGLGDIVGVNEDGSLKVAKWLSLRSALAGNWLGEVRIRFFPWRPRGVYDKGIVTPKGWVKPFKLKEA